MSGGGNGAVPTTTHVCRQFSGHTTGARCAALEGATFLFAHPSPNARVLIVVECPLQADCLNCAFATNCFGFGRLRDRWSRIPDREEELWVNAEARGFTPPIHYGYSFKSVSAGKACPHRTKTTVLSFRDWRVYIKYQEAIKKINRCVRRHVI